MQIWYCTADVHNVVNLRYKVDFHGRAENLEIFYSLDSPYHMNSNTW